MDRLPRLAVTTVLLHERDADLEVLLVRRPSTMVAFGDMWVFPGGQVDHADDGAHVRRLVDSHDLAHADQPFLAPDSTCPDPPPVSLFTAACRELFEEVGVLFAREATGAETAAASRAALLERRADIIADARRFYPALEARGLRLEIGRLIPWSRWITPPARTRRFDTIFFVSIVGDRTVVPEIREVAEARWLRLDDAIREGVEGARRLMAPTLLTLMQIAAAARQFKSAAAMLAGLPAQQLAPVRPRNLEADGRNWIVFPWDGEAGAPGAFWRTGFLAARVPGRICAEF